MKTVSNSETGLDCDAELKSLREVAGWAQAVLTAWNTGDLPRECALHKKLREAMIAHREKISKD